MGNHQPKQKQSPLEQQPTMSIEDLQIHWELTREEQQMRRVQRQIRQLRERELTKRIEIGELEQLMRELSVA